MAVLLVIENLHLWLSQQHHVLGENVCHAIVIRINCSEPQVSFVDIELTIITCIYEHVLIADLNGERKLLVDMIDGSLSGICDGVTVYVYVVI